MSLIRFTPYGYSDLQEQANRLFDQLTGAERNQSEGLGGGMFTPPVDVREDADAYHITLEAPGMRREQLDITLQENVLTVRGQKEQKQRDEEGQYRRIECSYGSFARTLTLPRNVDGSGVTANLHDGLLQVRLPKHEEAKPRQINIAGGATIEAENKKQS